MTNKQLLLFVFNVYQILSKPCPSPTALNYWIVKIIYHITLFIYFVFCITSCSFCLHSRFIQTNLSLEVKNIFVKFQEGLPDNAYSLKLFNVLSEIMVTIIIPPLIFNILTSFPSVIDIIMTFSAMNFALISLSSSLSVMTFTLKLIPP